MNNDGSGITEELTLVDANTGEVVGGQGASIPNADTPSEALSSSAGSSITFGDAADYASIARGSSLGDVTNILAARLQEFRDVISNPSATHDQRIVALSYVLATEMIWRGMLGMLETQGMIEMLSNIKAKKLSDNQ